MEIYKIIETLHLYQYLGTFVVILLGWMGRKSWQSRLKDPTEKINNFFSEKGLLTFSEKRFGYSDRLAYVLAEMSDLAYIDFEKTDVKREDTIRKLIELSDQLVDEQKATEFFDSVIKHHVSGSLGDVLESVLNANNFRLLHLIDDQDVQGFICKRERQGEAPYIIVSFRGSEKKIGDWLTNVDALPSERVSNQNIKVHRGFYESVLRVSKEIQEYIDGDEGKDGQGNQLPVFFTGHSLGGALAMVAAVLLAPKRIGACYTFGAPRVANYSFFFEKTKMPIYRVVNSADLVARLPPGPSTMFLVSKLIELLQMLLGRFKALVDFLDFIGPKVTRLKHYRHHGDLRYLTDVVDGSFNKTRLLSNPSAWDQIEWFWKGILTANVGHTIKSHGMALYRKKLKELAKLRNG